MIRSFNIGNRNIGESEPCFIIAEVAQAHEGTLSFAHSFIDSAATAGADAIKFQMHMANAESTKDEQFRISMGSQDKTRYDYWQRTSFDAVQWKELAEHADEAGLAFLCSAFSLEAVNVLRTLGVNAWKVASGEMFAFDFIQHLASDNLPLIISTGLASPDDVDAIVNYVESNNVAYALLQCTSRYPTPLKQVGINVMEQYRERYRCNVGLSDHSGTTLPSLVAMARGASIVEVHVTFNRGIIGPDTSSSITFDELKQLVAARDGIYELDSSPVDKYDMYVNLEDTRKLFTRSVAPRIKLAKGTRLEKSLLSAKKPAGGIPWSNVDEIIGRVLTKDVYPDMLLKMDDLQ